MAFFAFLPVYLFASFECWNKASLPSVTISIAGTRCNTTWWDFVKSLGECSATFYEGLGRRRLRVDLLSAHDGLAGSGDPETN